MMRVISNKLPGIKSFSIYKLHGCYDVSIEITDNVGIIVGENGLGKTTILSMLYFILSKRYDELISFNFESATIEFNSGNIVGIDKHKLVDVTKQKLIARIEEKLENKSINKSKKIFSYYFDSLRDSLKFN